MQPMNIKRNILIILSFTLCVLLCSFSPFIATKSETPFKRGEVLSYKLHYGIFNAGVADISVDPKLYRVNKNIFP